MQSHGKLSFPLSRLNGNGADDKEAGHDMLFNFLKGKAAKYHKSCLDKYNDRMVQRAKDAYTKRGDGGKEKASTNTDTDLTSPPCKRRSQTLPCKSKLLFCCFCGQEDIDKNLVAAGTYHARSTKANLEHVKHLKDKWIEMVKVVGKDNLLMILSSGDAAVNELYYHKQNSCYQSFRGAYLLKIKTPAIVDEHRKWYKDSALNKILYYIKVCTWKFSLIMMSNT